MNNAVSLVGRTHFLTGIMYANPISLLLELGSEFYLSPCTMFNNEKV